MAMNFFNLLKTEHKDVKNKFEELLSIGKIDRRECETLCHKLQLHMEMEEKYFYPVMEDFEETMALAEEAELEQKEAKKFIRALLNGDLDDVEYKVKLEMLQAEIGHHFDEEESQFFPKAQEVLSDEEVESITEKMVALKEKKEAASSR